MTIEQAIKHFEPYLDNDCYTDAHKYAVKMAIEALREKRERENPAPLTEDELRQMMGGPVWCVSESGASWFIVNKGLLSIVNGIKAYRHKPGEVQRND